MKNNRISFQLNDEKGFSLFELVIAIALLGVFALFSTGIIAINSETFNLINMNTTQKWDVRKAMQILKHDIQMIDPQALDNWGQGQQSGYGYRHGWHDKLYFITIDGIRMRYRYTSGSLQRRVGNGSWTEIIDNLNYYPFSYQDVSSTITTNKDVVAFIVVDFDRTLNGNTYSLMEKFYVRN